MITIPTVLILGAGASAHCGYPLGGELLSRLSSLRGSNELDKLPDQWTRDDVKNFLVRLSRSGHYSVDAFLETCPEHIPLGKFLMAQTLKKYENIDKLFPPNRSGWYQYLFNTLLVNGKPEFEKNSISIVTFNYDRSFEAYLHTAIQNRFQLSEAQSAEILKQIPIVHVHGILGKYPETPYKSQFDNSEILEISRQIQIVHEIRDQDDDFCNDMFRQAHVLLKAAERIFFLGFGFHLDNVRRFRFFTPANTAGKMLKATSSGLRPLELESLIENLKEYGFTREFFRPSGTSCESFYGETIRLV
jgi:hypothetical protein